MGEMVGSYQGETEKRKGEMERLSAAALIERHSQVEQSSQEPAKEDRKSIPATERQLSYLRALLVGTGEAPDDRRAKALITTMFGSEPQMAEVSRHIDRLKGLPRSVEQVNLPFVPRPNKYAGKCLSCGLRVPEEKGILTKADDGKWEVHHKDGECPVSEFSFPFGRYAVEGEDGAMKFYHVSPDGLFVQASDELHRVHVNAQEAIVAKIEKDPKEAALTYGRELGECGRCGKKLTSEWRKLGIGPVCDKKGWS
jgi:hypothetical protein